MDDFENFTDFSSVGEEINNTPEPKQGFRSNVTNLVDEYVSRRLIQCSNIHDGVIEIMRKPYHINSCFNQEDQTWVAYLKEFPGCMTCANTWAELGYMIMDAMYLWILSCMEDGESIPLPEDAPFWATIKIV